MLHDGKKAGFSFDSFVISSLVIIVVVLILFFVAANVGEEFDSLNNIAIGFCINKTGLHNITEYNYTLPLNFDGLLNCSDKKNPIGDIHLIASGEGD